MWKEFLSTKYMEKIMKGNKKDEIEAEVIEVTEEYLKDRLYVIRGKRVLLDVDLAEIYGYDTKNFNRQVKNNIEKFDKDFMFELTDDGKACIILSLNPSNSRGLECRLVLMRSLCRLLNGSEV